MKNKFFTILLSLFLTVQISVFATEDVAQNMTETLPVVEETINTQQQNEDNDLSAESMKQDLSSPYKTPISKKKIVKKFLLALFGVVISSLMLYLGLTLYNRVRNNILNKVKTPEGETPLESPCDMESAVKSFLDKTGW